MIGLDHWSDYGHIVNNVQLFNMTTFTAMIEADQFENCPIYVMHACSAVYAPPGK